jgi:archaemetzincin
MEENINLLVLNDISRTVLRHLARNLSQIFETDVKVSRTIIIPSMLFNEEKRKYEGRKLLKFLTENMTLGEVKGINLALFDRDIYTGSADYVFGVASPFPKIGIVSLLRLHPHFEEDYFAGGLKKRKAGKFPLLVRRLSGAEKTVYYERILKEAIHSIGHSMGLIHCDHSQCIMYPSGKVSDVDNKTTSFCKTCRSQL